MKKHILIALVLVSLILTACDKAPEVEQPVAEIPAAEATVAQAPAAVEEPTKPPPTAVPPTEIPPTATNTAIPPTEIPPTETPLPQPERIVFSSNRGDNPGELDLYILDLDTMEITPLDTGFDTAFLAQWSPDGEQVIFAIPGVWNLYTITTDGAELTQLTDFRSNNGHWSPDGSRIVFQSDHQNEPEDTPDIYIIDSNGENMVEILDTPDVPDFGPRWSPTGEQILYVSGPAGVFDIYTMNTGGSEITQITDVGNATSAAWSPDGNSIVFAAGAQVVDLYIIDKDGTTESLVRLTEDEFANNAPAWSPDGEKIVFYSNRSGNLDLWTINADGTGLTQLTDDAFINFFPDWSP